MSLAQAIADSRVIKRTSIKREYKPGYATGIRLAHLHRVFREPSKWNKADIACYYAKVFYSVFGYTMFPSWPHDAQIASVLVDQWGSDVKTAIQIYFSNLGDYVPLTMNGIVSQYSRGNINRCLETNQPLSVKVLDKKVFADWL